MERRLMQLENDVSELLNQTHTLSMQTSGQPYRTEREDCILWNEFFLNQKKIFIKKKELIFLLVSL